MSQSCVLHRNRGENRTEQYCMSCRALFVIRKFKGFAALGARVTATLECPSIMNVCCCGQNVVLDSWQHANQLTNPPQQFTQFAHLCHALPLSAFVTFPKCAFIPAPQFTPCGENAVCSTAGVCEADKRSRRTVAPTITTTDNVLKIKATSGVDITVRDLYYF